MSDTHAPPHSNKYTVNLNQAQCLFMMYILFHHLPSSGVGIRRKKIHKTTNKIISMFIILSNCNHQNFIVRLVQCNNHRGDFQPLLLLWGSVTMDHISYHCIITIHEVK